MKPRISPLKLVRETVRELSPAELRQVAGGATLPPSEPPTCYCVPPPPSQLPNICLAVSGVIC